MKTMSKVVILGACTVLMLVVEIPFMKTLDEAEAVYGVRRRTARRTAVVVGSATAASAGAATAAANEQAAAANQQAAAANQQAAAAQEQAATATAEADAAKQETVAAQAEAEAYKQQAATAQAAAPPLAIGTVVTALPAGCTAVTSGGVEYQSCGKNTYRAAFQGSQLVYVTAQP